MDGDLFQKLWDELLAQPGVSNVYIIAFRGEEPEEGDLIKFSYKDTSTDPIQQLKDSIDYLRANPQKFGDQKDPPKKRGPKKKS